MVWCNQLVQSLARLLQFISQPSILTHASHQAAQHHIVRLMQAVTQPNVTSLLGWEHSQKGSGTATHIPSGLVSTAGQECQLRTMATGSTAADGQMLDVIRVSDTKHCQEK